MMSVLVDTHVHLYPCYDMGVALGHLVENLHDLSDADCYCACLAEREDCDAFATLAAGGAEFGDVRVEPVDEITLRVERRGQEMFLFAGRQVVTAERLEVLSLASVSRIPGERTAGDTADAVRDSGGVPVLAWAPGKWMFRRAPVVHGMVMNAGPGELLLGDSTLRPWCWREPLPMRMGARCGLGIVAGSDPLPAPGEEMVAGSYASLLDGEFDAARPMQSIRMLLRGAPSTARRVGRRSGLFETFFRIRRYR
jgi:hypothetical protein